MHYVVDLKWVAGFYRAETSKAMSVPRKQRRAYINEDYLELVLLAGLRVDEK